MTVGPAIAAAALALIHLYATRLRALSGFPRSHWLSVAGGIAVAYVFIHLLPELMRYQEELTKKHGAGFLGMADRHLFLVALIGLVAFYSVETIIASRTGRGGGDGEDESATPGAFWSHVVIFALYNALIGYLLVRREAQTGTELALFATAMAMHFFVNDYSLREHHKGRYIHRGRWILAAAVIVGWAGAMIGKMPLSLTAVLFGLLAGGIMLNVLKEELPQQRRSSLIAFVSGVAGYSALLLVF